MKKLLPVILLLIFVFITNGQNKLQNPWGVYSFQVSGKIKGYQPNKNNGFITLSSYLIDGKPESNQVKIDENGSFSATLSQPFEGDFEIGYNGRFVGLYCSPAEKITIEIDEATWKLKGSETSSIKIFGKSSIISKYIIDFENEKRNHQFKTDINWKEFNIHDEIFAKTSFARMQEELDFFNKYLAKNKITNIKFRNWGKNSIIYETAFNISVFYFLGKPNKTITYDILLSYLKPIQFNNQTAFSTSYYYRFIKAISTDFQAIVNVNPIYQNALKEAGNNRLLFGINKLDQYASGISKELLYYFLFRNYEGRAEFSQDFERFNAVVKNPYLKMLGNVSKNRFQENFVPVKVIDQAKTFPEGVNLAAQLSDLLQKYKGSNVFVYFWGSWCGPCMKAMPLFPKLISEMEGKPIFFLFVAVDTEQQAIEEIKNKYQIKGEFISLNGNEKAILNKVLKFSSYPRHFILDPSGTTINIGNPISLDSEQSVKQLVEEITRTFKVNEN